MLIVFGGLPATGKTTVAQLVARACGAAYLRIDAIEQALRSADVLAGDVGPAGYAVAYALSEANLALGRMVVADCVNPLRVTRAAWRAVAASTSSPIIEAEIICSDLAEHRRRVEGRTIDIPGLTPPNWASVLAHDYEPWSGPRMIIDTAQTTATEAAAKILAAIDMHR
jgi:predicted kinase